MTGSVRVAVTPERVEAVPGSSVTLAVRVVNGSRIVDEFAIAVVGAAADWAVVDRPRVSLLPDREETVEVILSVPSRPPPPAGPQTAGVRVVSVTQPGVAWVEELPVLVAPVTAAAATVNPQQVRGGRAGRFSVRVVNEGNVALRLGLRGEDPEQAVAFAFDPPRLEVAPGQAAASRVQVSAPRAWTGPAVTRPLRVHAEGGGEPLSATATFIQRPRLAGGVARAGMALAAAALLGGVLFAGPWLDRDSTPEVAPTASPTLTAESTPTTTPTPTATASPTISPTPPEPGRFAIPAVKDRPQREAVAALEGACQQATGCLEVFVVQQFDEFIADGLVLGVEPPAGTEVEVGDEVILTVSRGEQPFVTPQSREWAFAGKWVNADSESQGVTRLEIEQDGDTVIVHAWEHCTPSDCDRGVELGVVENRIAVVEWDHGTARRTMRLFRLSGELKVNIETRFADGRQTTEDRETFEPAWTPPTLPNDDVAPAP